MNEEGCNFQKATFLGQYSVIASPGQTGSRLRCVSITRCKFSGLLRFPLISIGDEQIVFPTMEMFWSVMKSKQGTDTQCYSVGQVRLRPLAFSNELCSCIMKSNMNCFDWASQPISRRKSGLASPGQTRSIPTVLFNSFKGIPDNIFRLICQFHSHFDGDYKWLIMGWMKALLANSVA